MSGPAGDHVDYPPPGDSRDVIGGERLDSIETLLSQLTSIIKSLVGQRGDQVESSVSFAAAPGSGGTEYAGVHQSDVTGRTVGGTDSSVQGFGMSSMWVGSSSLADSGLNLRAIVVCRSSAGGSASGGTDAGWHPVDATGMTAGGKGSSAQVLGMSSVRVGSSSLLDSDLNPHASAVNRPSAGAASFGSIGTVSGASGSSQSFGSGMVSGTLGSQSSIPGMVSGALGSQSSIPPPSTPSSEWWGCVASGNTYIPGVGINNTGENLGRSPFQSSQSFCF